MGLSSYTEVPPDFVGQTLNSAACSLFQHKFRSGLLCASFFVSFVWLVAAAALFCIPELGTIRGHERESESERPQGTQSRVTRSNQEVRSSSLQVPKGRHPRRLLEDAI